MYKIRLALIILPQRAVLQTCYRRTYSIRVFSKIFLLYICLVCKVWSKVDFHFASFCTLVYFTFLSDNFHNKAKLIINIVDCVLSQTFWKFHSKIPSRSKVIEIVVCCWFKLATLRRAQLLRKFLSKICPWIFWNFWKR